MALCWLSRFGLARVSAALAVAMVVAGWAAAQAPRMLPGVTVSQAAAGRGTLVALVIAVACGAVVLVPSLALLYTLFLRGRLDAPDDTAAGEAADAHGARDPGNTPPERPSAPAGPRLPRATAAAAIAGLIAGAVLLVFADAAWAHALGVACLVLCAVAAFRLTTGLGE
jgi:cytochrome d ubiquinol oxidase subunit II